MIQFLSCSKCEKNLVLPKDVSEKATLSCPSCEEQFVLEELLAERFGYWKVISDPGAELKLASEPDFRPRPKSLTPAQQLAAERASRRAPSTADDGEELRISEPIDEPQHKQQFTSVEPITHEQFERMKRKAKSPLWSAIQIGLGGVAAIPISLILIWHLVGKDIGGTATFVAQYVPWIVPEEFRPEPTEEEYVPPDEAEGDKEAPKSGESGFRQFSDEELSGSGEEEWENAGMTDDDDEDPGDSGSQSQEMAERIAQAGSGDDARSRSGSGASGGRRGGGLAGPIGFSTGPEPGMPEGDNPPGTEPTEDSGGNSPKAEVDSAGSGALGRGTPGAESQQEDEPGEQSSKPDKNSTSSASPPSAAGNVYSKIVSCDADITEWLQGGDSGVDSHNKLAASIYTQLVGLTDELAKLPAGSPFFKAVRDKMQPIGKAIQQSEQCQNLISEQSDDWIQDNEGSPFSVVLMVQLDAIEEDGKFWKTSLNGEELGFSLESLRIPRSIAPSLKDGQELLIFGKVNSDAQEPELTAYYIYSL